MTIEASVILVSENNELLQKIIKTKAADELKFLDSKPFRTAILQLKGAIGQAETLCEKVLDEKKTFL